jgi:hypothetical protein
MAKVASGHFENGVAAAIFRSRQDEFKAMSMFGRERENQ